MFLRVSSPGFIRQRGESDACLNRLLYEKGMLTFSKWGQAVSGLQALLHWLMDWFEAKITGDPPYFMGKSLVSCWCSLKPIHWDCLIIDDDFLGGLSKILGMITIYELGFPILRTTLQLSNTAHVPVPFINQLGITKSMWWIPIDSSILPASDPTWLAGLQWENHRTQWRIVNQQWDAMGVWGCWDSAIKKTKSATILALNLIV